MYIHEHIAIRMAKERMEDALRSAEHLRVLRLTRPPRRPARVYLGLALIRLGRWLQGQPSSTPAAPVGLGQA
jgi:hypothetical protein